MGLSNRNFLSIAEVVIYGPSLALSFAICIRHGFHIFAGWVFLVIFCMLRIAGAALNLATIKSPTTIVFHTIPIELFAVGQVLILYAVLSLLARLANGINKTQPIVLKALHFHLMRIPFIAGIVLVIIGTDQPAMTFIMTGTYPIQHLTKIGIIIFVGAFGVLLLMVSMIRLHRARAEPMDRLLLDIIVASLPLVLLRLIYSLLIIFLDSAAFNPRDGNVAAEGFLAVMEEMIVVIMYFFLGFTLPQLPKKVDVKAGGDRWSRRRIRAMEGIQRFRNFIDRLRGYKVAVPEAAGGDHV